MQPQDISMLKPPSSALRQRERQPTGSTHPTTAMSSKSRGFTPLKMPPLVQETPRGAVFSSEQSLLGNPEDSNPCFISFRKSITETRSLATEIGRFTDSGSLSTATGHKEEGVLLQDESHRQSMAVVIEDTPSIRDSGILPQIQEFRSFSPQEIPAPSVQNFPKSFTYGRAGLNTPLRDLHYAMPPAGPSTFLTENPTITNTRRSELMSRETSAFGDEKKPPQVLPAIKERSVRHSLPVSNRAATAKRQVRNFEDTMWNGQKTVRLGIVNQRRLIRHGVHHLTHKLGMECNFQLMHFGRQIGDLMSDLKREMKFQDDTNKMMDYQIWQLNQMKEQIEKDTREATYDVTHIEMTAHARNKKSRTQEILY